MDPETFARFRALWREKSYQLAASIRRQCEPPLGYLTWDAFDDARGVPRFRWRDGEQEARQRVRATLPATQGQPERATQQRGS